MKYYITGLLFSIMTIIGLIIYPFIYLIYDWVFNKKVFILWWFLNSDEPTFKENKYGANWWIEKKNIKLNTKLQRFISSYRWVAIRNSIYTLKLKLIPKKGKIESIKIIYNTTSGNGLTFCNEVLHGKQYAKYKIKGQKQFRRSATVKFLWFVMNYQFGMSEKRYLYKLRFWNKNIL